MSILRVHRCCRIKSIVSPSVVVFFFFQKLRSRSNTGWLNHQCIARMPAYDDDDGDGGGGDDGCSRSCRVVWWRW